MSMMKIVFRMLDKAGLGFIEPRREDGHGSAPENPSYTKDSTDSEYLRFAGSVNNAGDNLLVTPAAGKRIRLHWVYAINDPVAMSSTKITVKLGDEVQFVAWAISKRQQMTGPVDGALRINLSNPGDVAVTVFYQEV